jgi:peroxiredoxin
MRGILLFGFISSVVISACAQAKKNQPAPEISLPAPGSNIIHLSDLKGSVVVLDFWASWCPPCRENNPHLAKLYKKYHDRGLEILSISLDSNEDSWKQAIAQDNLVWLQVNDNKGWNAPSIMAYDVGAIPTMFLIDKKGIIRERDLVGWRLEDEIKHLLRK